MQPIKQLAKILLGLADNEHYLFSLADLKSAMPQQSREGFKALVYRGGKDGLLKRICRGLYLYPPVEVAQPAWCSFMQQRDYGLVRLIISALRPLSVMPG